MDKPLIMYKCRRAVRLLELRAQITFSVRGVLQYSNASGCALPHEDIWLHTMHSRSLRPSLQVLVSVPTVSAMNYLVKLMESRESSATRAVEVQKCERSPKRQKKSSETADQGESLDDSSTNMRGILEAEKETTSASLEGVYNCPSWYGILLAQLLRVFCVSTLAVQT